MRMDLCVYATMQAGWYMHVHANISIVSVCMSASANECFYACVCCLNLPLSYSRPRSLTIVSPRSLSSRADLVSCCSFRKYNMHALTSPDEPKKPTPPKAAGILLVPKCSMFSQALQ